MEKHNHSLEVLPFILAQMGASQAEPIAHVQSLWSGYGDIVRYQLYGCEKQTVIVKHVCPPNKRHHPRGWDTNLGHNRKLQSYEVEANWYQHWAAHCDHYCRVPTCFGLKQANHQTTILLEDLDSCGFPLRLNRLNTDQIHACLAWLAHFHASFIEQEPVGLWPVGTYWHLNTRPDEWEAMTDGPLKMAAAELDNRLNDAHFKTLVHGDAKVANFCFSGDKNVVAAVDFQYVGGGCGIKDVAYFMGSCLSEEECEQQEEAILTYYFESLTHSLQRLEKTVDCKLLEQEWRTLYPFAWADFTRFLQGWMPGHKKLNHYSSQLTQVALSNL